MVADRSGEVIAIASVFLVLATLFVGLRIYVRGRILKTIGWDDWTLVIAFVLFLLYIACQLEAAVHGTGRHVSDVGVEEAQLALKFWFLCELFYILCTLFLKVSIGLFLLRIAINRAHIWVIRVVIVATVVFSLAFWFIALFQCHPIRLWWHLTGHEGHCLNPHIFVSITFTASSLNSTADWVFGTIPILIVRDLQMNLKTKAVVATLLGFAAIGSTATIVRMPYIWQLGDTKAEFLYDTVELAIWSTVELGVGLIAASAATLRPLWQRFLAATGFSLSSNLSKPTMKKVPSFVTPIRPTNLPVEGIQFEQLSRRDERATTTTTVTGNPSRKPKHKDTGYFNSLSSKSSHGRGQHTSKSLSGNRSICNSTSLSTHASGDRDEGFFVCETCHTDPTTPQSWRIDISRSVHITTADAIEEQGLKDYFDISQLSPIAASPTNEPEPETTTPDELPELQFLGGKDWEKS